MVHQSGLQQGPGKQDQDPQRSETSGFKSTLQLFGDQWILGMSLMFLACCSSPTEIVDPVGKLTVQAYVFPTQGNSPLTVFVQATIMWEDGLGVPIDFYEWSVNGKTVAKFNLGSFVITSSGLHEVCVKVGNNAFRLKAEDCEMVSVS